MSKPETTICPRCGKEAVVFDTSCRACGRLTPRMEMQCHVVAQKACDVFFGLIAEGYKNA